MSSRKTANKAIRHRPSLPVYDFTLVLSGINRITPRIEKALFEAGCDDATLSMRNGRVFLTFSRQGTSRSEAILSAIRDVYKADIGAEIILLDESNLVTQADIARRIGRTRQWIHQCVAGVRGPGGFPPPVGHVTPKTPVWFWSDVARWLKQHRLSEAPVVCDAWQVAVINNELERRYLEKVHSESPTEFLQRLEAMCRTANVFTDTHRCLPRLTTGPRGR